MPLTVGRSDGLMTGAVPRGMGNVAAVGRSGASGISDPTDPTDGGVPGSRKVKIMASGHRKQQH